MAKWELPAFESSKSAYKPERRFGQPPCEKLQRRQKIIPADPTKAYERNALWVIWCKEKDYCWHRGGGGKQSRKERMCLWRCFEFLKEHLKSTNNEQIGLTKSLNFAWKGKVVAASPDQYLLVNKSAMFFLSASAPAITQPQRSPLPIPAAFYRQVNVGESRIVFSVSQTNRAQFGGGYHMTGVSPKPPDRIHEVTV